MRSIASTNPNSIKSFESAIFSSFDKVISMNVSELVPYAIQILALMLPLDPDGGIGQAYSLIVKSIVVPNLWSSKGKIIRVLLGGSVLLTIRNIANIPALSGLVCKFMEKDPLYMVREKHLQQILGIVQRLIETKTFDYFAFEILESIFINVEM